MSEPAAKEVRVAIVFHSVRGHTRALAEAVQQGVEATGSVATLHAVDADMDWDVLHAADALVFGSPTFMGSVSAPFKAFMDASSKQAWVGQRWRDKPAAGFTHSSTMGGDKHNVLVQLSVFAAQHGMIWTSLAARGGDQESDLNRFGSSLGAMARSRSGQRVPSGDLRTAHHLGRRVAGTAFRWKGGPTLDVDTGADPSAPRRHPATAHWTFPPSRTPLPLPLRRTNLAELAARPGRFEHHLMVVGTVGDLQIEIATASEPVYFAHANISDEYAVAMPTGDSLADGFPMRTVVLDRVSRDETARYKHLAGDLLLHPHGHLHWPGRLRPPYEPFVFAPGTRRSGYTLVFCGRRPIAPGERTLRSDRPEAIKPYVDPSPPTALFDLLRGPLGGIAEVGNARVELVDGKARTFERGGFVAVIDADLDGAYARGDFVFVAPGATCEMTGVRRALVFTADVAPDAPPTSWDEVPEAPFPPFEDAERHPLPFESDGLRVQDVSPTVVRVSVGDAHAEVPRYWMARMLYRLALHGFRLGHLETYGGFSYEDHGEGDAPIEFGVRESRVPVAREEVGAFVERLYRAVAPEGYVERLT